MDAIALFCDSVRPEVEGTETVTGILPDNIVVPRLPVTVPRLSIYYRLHIPVDEYFNKIETSLQVPDGTEHALTDVDMELISRTRDEAADAGSGYFGLILRAQMVPFRLDFEGRYLALLKVDGSPRVCGSLFVHPRTGGDDA